MGTRNPPSSSSTPLVTFPIAILRFLQLARADSAEWAILLGVGVSTQLAQVYMTRGLQAETAVRATTTGYLQIVFAGLWGALLLHERPSAWTLVGAAVIVGSALVLAFGKAHADVGDE
jgi:drug/metabolite transporter (DMT)-like permease